MSDGDPVLLLLDADLSSRGLVRALRRRGVDVLAAGAVDDLKQLDDPVLFAAAQELGRVLLTHNVHDFPGILRDWAEAGRSHRGCILSFVATNDYGEMSRRFDRWLRRFPAATDWIDRVVAL